MSERLAVVGSRDFPNPEFVRQYIAWMSGHGEQKPTIVSGAARGRRPERSVDHLAALAARELGLRVDEIPAQWDGPLGKLAGKDRNFDVVLSSGKVAAFWDGWSPGTAHAIALAACHGNLARVVLPGDLTLAELRARELGAR